MNLEEAAGYVYMCTQLKDDIEHISKRVAMLDLINPESAHIIQSSISVHLDVDIAINAIAAQKEKLLDKIAEKKAKINSIFPGSYPDTDKTQEGVREMEL